MSAIRSRPRRSRPSRSSDGPSQRPGPGLEGRATANVRAVRHARPPGPVRSASLPQRCSLPSFLELGVPSRLLPALTAQGVTDPFPIQADTLPDTLAGRDVLGRGRTGSGKTLAFALPMVARLSGRLAGGTRRSGRPLGLVLAPTRELATQIAAVIEPLAEATGLTVTTVFGGVSQQRQVQALKAGVDILVACPGRLEDLLKQRMLTLDAVEITVLDEADHMADLGFLPAVTRLLAATPAGGQRVLFSRTPDNGGAKLGKQILADPGTQSAPAGP